jgi:hypothetical protein
MHRPHQNLTIRDALLLITGIAAAFGMFAPQFKDFTISNFHDWLDALCVLLGGLSLVGVPLLLWQRRKDPRLWSPGCLFWFATGVTILFALSVLLVHQFRIPKGTPPQELMKVTTVRPTGATQGISGTNLFYPLGIQTMQGQPVERSIIIARLLQFLAIPLFAPAWLLAILASRRLRPAFKRTSP